MNIEKTPRILPRNKHPIPKRKRTQISNAPAVGFGFRDPRDESTPPPTKRRLDIPPRRTRKPANVNFANNDILDTFPVLPSPIGYPVPEEKAVETPCEKNEADLTTSTLDQNQYDNIQNVEGPSQDRGEETHTNEALLEEREDEEALQNEFPDQDNDNDSLHSESSHQEVENDTDNLESEYPAQLELGEMISEMDPSVHGDNGLPDHEEEEEEPEDESLDYEPYDNNTDDEVSDHMRSDEGQHSEASECESKQEEEQCDLYPEEQEEEQCDLYPEEQEEEQGTSEDEEEERPEQKENDAETITYTAPHQEDNVIRDSISSNPSEDGHTSSELDDIMDSDEDEEGESKAIYTMIRKQLNEHKDPLRRRNYDEDNSSDDSEVRRYKTRRGRNTRAPTSYKM